MSNRDLFLNIVNPAITLGSRKSYTVPFSILAHVLGVGALVIAPLVAADALPTPPAMLAFVTPPPPPPPPAPPRAERQQQQRVASINADAAPVEAPAEITPETLRPLENPMETAVIDGVQSGVVEGLTELILTAPPPARPKPLRVGGNIQPPQKTKHVNPNYPAIARAARVQGVVIIEATIGPDGRVQEAKVLRSIPLLDQAALEAVTQWEFTPTLLNGVPVAVVMTVTVNFTLQ